MKEYKTVRLESNNEFIEKKSRFIGYVKPVETQQQAVEFNMKSNLSIGMQLTMFPHTFYATE